MSFLLLTGHPISSLVNPSLPLSLPFLSVQCFDFICTHMLHAEMRHVMSVFDILAVNVFAFDEKWRFAFAKNSDLPSSKYKGYTDYQKHHLLATLVTVHWPPEPPFHEEPFTLMNEML